MNTSCDTKRRYLLEHVAVQQPSVEGMMGKRYRKDYEALVAEGLVTTDVFSHRSTGRPDGVEYYKLTEYGIAEFGGERREYRPGEKLF